MNAPVSDPDFDFAGIDMTFSHDPAVKLLSVSGFQPVRPLPAVLFQNYAVIPFRGKRRKSCCGKQSAKNRRYDLFHALYSLISLIFELQSARRQMQFLRFHCEHIRMLHTAGMTIHEQKIAHCEPLMRI